MSYDKVCCVYCWFTNDILFLFLKIVFVLLSKQRRSSLSSGYSWFARVPVRVLARQLRAKFRPDCAIPDTSKKFGTVVDHD